METIKSKVKAIGTYLNVKIQTIQANLTTSRPWLGDYLNPSKFSKPYKREACRRIKENSLYFLRNYLITFAILFMIMTLSKPLFLAVFAMICALWWYVYSQSGIKIAGKTLPSNITFTGLAFFTVSICLYLAWDTLLGAYAIMKFFILFHSLYHELPPNTISV